MKKILIQDQTIFLINPVILYRIGIMEMIEINIQIKITMNTFKILPQIINIHLKWQPQMILAQIYQGQDIKIHIITVKRMCIITRLLIINTKTIIIKIMVKIFRIFLKIALFKIPTIIISIRILIMCILTIPISRIII
jgi:hypothetical protein